jgi:hypothetical protein
MGQKPALPRRSIGVRFALNKQTLTERVQCDAMCHERTNALQQKASLFGAWLGQFSFEQSRGTIFLSTAYLAEASSTSGSITVSSAVYQSEITFHALPSHC